MKLTLRKASMLDDWYIIERAEHDGRVWMESTGPNSSALRCSSRFSDADVEGTAEEMLAIADAIEARRVFTARRCAVEITWDGAEFWSPRNSITPGRTSIREADELVVLIRQTLEAA